MIFGEERQTIFQHKNADSRFLTKAKDIFGSLLPGMAWETMSLSTTYRLTASMVRFQNESVLGRQHFRTNNSKKWDGWKASRLLCARPSRALRASQVRAGRRCRAIGSIIMPASRMRGLAGMCSAGQMAGFCQQAVVALAPRRAQVQYRRGDPYEIAKEIAAELVVLLRKGIFSERNPVKYVVEPGDIFILARTPVSRQRVQIGE